MKNTKLVPPLLKHRRENHLDLPVLFYFRSYLVVFSWLVSDCFENVCSFNVSLFTMSKCFFFFAKHF